MIFLDSKCKADGIACAEVALFRTYIDAVLSLSVTPSGGCIENQQTKMADPLVVLLDIHALIHLSNSAVRE